MAVIKRIVVLANSAKNSGRCLAGKELVWNGARWEVGGWVRPVASAKGAEVPVSWMIAQFGREPKLLNVINIPLEEAAPLPDQPENWLLVKRAKWTDRGTFPVQDASRLLDYPPTLWGTPQRSVPAGFVQEMTEPASLYLIEPAAIGPIRIWAVDMTDEDGRHFDRHRRRITLNYRETEHEFTVTDLKLQERYYTTLPERGEPMRTVLLPKEKTYVCVSLTPLWQGKHYKIAAGFVQMNHAAG